MVLNKESCLKSSLSVLLPVFNGQSTLGPEVAQLLEILPELTPTFELLIIDDGSSDDTGEVAHELSLDYPQASLITHPLRLGMKTAMRTGLDRATSDLVLFRDESCEADLFEIHKLWAYTPEHNVILGRCSTAAGASLRRHVTSPALQLFRRRIVQGWQLGGGNEELLSYLTRKGYPALNVEVRRRASLRDRASLRELASVGFSGSEDPGLAATRPSRLDSVGVDQPRSGEPKRPNYLARLRAFAWGE
jgi:hypothetical protein